MKTAIVVLHWKDVNRTKKLISKLLDWSEVKPTIFLVQNESTQDSFPDLYHNAIVKIYSKQNLGYGGGNNLGLQAAIKANYDYSILLNTDAHIEEIEAKKLLKQINAQPNIFSIGPKLIEYNEGDSITYIGGRNIAKHMNTRIRLDEVELNEQPCFEVDYTIGAILVLNHHYLKQTGLFDCDYFFSGEVADLCYRAKQLNGQSITLLTSTGHHYTESNQLRRTLYHYYSLRNRFIFIRKHPKEKQYLRKWNIIVFKEMIHGIITFNTEKIKTIGYTIIDILLKRKGNRNKIFIQ